MRLAVFLRTEHSVIDVVHNLISAIFILWCPSIRPIIEWVGSCVRRDPHCLACASPSGASLASLRFSARVAFVLHGLPILAV